MVMMVMMKDDGDDCDDSDGQPGLVKDLLVQLHLEGCCGPENWSSDIETRLRPKSKMFWPWEWWWMMVNGDEDDGIAIFDLTQKYWRVPSWQLSTFLSFLKKAAPAFLAPISFMIKVDCKCRSCCRIFLYDVISSHLLYTWGNKLLNHLFVMFSINSPFSLSLSVLYARPSSPCSLGLPSPTSHRCFMFSSWW